MNFWLIVSELMNLSPKPFVKHSKYTRLLPDVKKVFLYLSVKLNYRIIVHCLISTSFHYSLFKIRNYFAQLTLVPAIFHSCEYFSFVSNKKCSLRSTNDTFRRVTGRTFAILKNYFNCSKYLCYILCVY